MDIERGLIALLASLAIGASACTGVDAVEPQTDGETWIGRTSQADTLIGLAWSDARLIGYVCDEPAGTTESWFLAKLPGSSIDLTNSGGARLEATRDDAPGGFVTGTFTPASGPALTFSVPRASGSATLVRAEWQDGTASGWIQLDDGTVRGSGSTLPSGCICNTTYNLVFCKNSSTGQFQISHSLTC